MTHEEAVLRLEGVTKRYCPLRTNGFALAPATLEIHLGTWTAFTGRSGAGKTTLLQLLATLDRPDTGRVWVFGRDTTEASETALSEIRRNRIGIVYQQFHFIDHLPVWQNITCRLVPTGMASGSRRELAAGVLRELEMQDCLDRSPRTLSGGEKQRAVLARAIIHKPDLLIADEPTSNIDATTGAMIRNHLQSLKENGTAIVVATHDSAVLASADHHFIMERGRILP